MRPGRASALAVEMQVRAGQREDAIPGRLDGSGAAVAKPEVAEQVEHHRRRMQARRDQRRAGHRAHLQLELRDVAGVDAVVAGVVRPRRHLVGDQRAVGEHEELDAEHADVVDRLGDAAPARSLAPATRGVTSARAGTRVTARMPSRCTFSWTGRWTTAPSRPRGDDDADLGGQRQALLEHAGDAAERGEGAGQLGAIGDAHLALAVVAEPRRLQDAGQSASSTLATSAPVAISRCGAQAMPLRAKAAFSAARSWQIATAAARRRDRPAPRPASRARRRARSRTRS